MNRLDERINDVLSRNEKILCCVLPLGDPDFQTSKRLVNLFMDSGVDIVELMIPSKKPYFDSIQLQQSCQRALANESDYESYMTLIADIRKTHPDEPFEIMTYSDVVQTMTPERFVEGLKAADVDANLIADSIATDPSLLSSLDQHLDAVDIPRIRFMPHPFDESLLPDIAENGKGFMILQSKSNEEGERPEVQSGNRELIQRVRSSGTDAAILLGYGLRDPERVREAVALDPDGVIIGTTLMEHIAEKDYDTLAELIRNLKSATKPN